LYAVYLVSIPGGSKSEEAPYSPLSLSEDIRSSIFLGERETSHFVHGVTEETVLGDIGLDVVQLRDVDGRAVQRAVDIVVDVGGAGLGEAANDRVLIPTRTLIATIVRVVTELLRNWAARTSNSACGGSKIIWLIRQV
jgi:hypothetical protein